MNGNPVINFGGNAPWNAVFGTPIGNPGGNPINHEAIQRAREVREAAQHARVREYQRVHNLQFGGDRIPETESYFQRFGEL